MDMVFGQFTSSRAHVRVAPWASSHAAAR